MRVKSFDEKREEYYREKDEEQEYLQNLSNEAEAEALINEVQNMRTCSRCKTQICPDCRFNGPTCFKGCEANICSKCLGMNKKFSVEGLK